MLVVLSCSCSLWRYTSGKPPAEVEVNKLANQLDRGLRIPALKNAEAGILTFVDLNDLERAEPVGRYLQERLAKALFDLGYRIVEIRLGREIMTEPLTGERILSRVREQLKENVSRPLKSVVVGIYSETSHSLYVSCRWIELENNQVRSCAEMFIPKGKLLKRLYSYLPSETGKLAKDIEIFERFPRDLGE
jgi:hypothetical protein